MIAKKDCQSWTFTSIMFWGTICLVLVSMFKDAILMLLGGR